MRVVILGLALALAGPTMGVVTLAAAEVQVSTPPLAEGEVLLQLNGNGRVTTRADLATFHVQVSASGATEEEARQAAQAIVQRVMQAVRGVGVAAADVDAGRITIGESYDYMGMNAMTADMAMDLNAAEETENMAGLYEPRKSASSFISIRLRNLARSDDLIRAVEQAGAGVTPMPEYALLDTAGPRREARGRALAAARAEAEAYAASLGMRVVRIIRVTERLGMDFFSMMMNEQEMRRQMGNDGSSGPDIVTSVIVGVDFALAPR